MAMNSILSSAKLPPKSLNDDTQDDELPETNIDEQRAPPVNMGNSREAGDGVTDVDPATGRADAKDHIPAPQLSTETDVAPPADSNPSAATTEEEALRIRSTVNGTDQTDRKEDADDLAKQLARPKHATA